jgi:hypothetical protein
MNSERDMIHDSLEPEEADWADFEARVLGKTDDCLTFEEIFTLAAQDRTSAHLDSCPRCKRWYESYRNSRTTRSSSKKEVPTPGSLLAAVVAPPPSPATDDMPEGNTLVWSEIQALFMEGKTSEALQELQVFLAGLLEEYGGKAAWTDDFRVFLAAQIRQNALDPQNFHELVLGFLRERAQAEKEPWKPTVRDPQESIFRSLVRWTQHRIKPTDPRYQFLQETLDQGVTSLEGMQRVYMSRKVSATPLDSTAYDEIRGKIEKTRDRFSSLLFRRS